MRITLKKSILICLIVLLYTRAVWYYLQENETQHGSVVEPKNEEKSEDSEEEKLHGNQRHFHFERNILQGVESSALSAKDIHKETSSVRKKKSNIKIERKDRMNKAGNEMQNAKIRGKKDLIIKSIKKRPNNHSSKLNRDVNPAEKSKTMDVNYQIKIKSDLKPTGREYSTKNRAIGEQRKESILGKVNVFVYKDVVPQYDNTNLYWNPLFPNLPSKSYFVDTLEDKGLVDGTVARRFLGFLHINRSGYYTFKAVTRMAIDFLLFDGKISNETVLLRFCFNEDRMRKQNISVRDFYREESNEVWLDGGKAYPFDLTHLTLFFGRFSLKFKSRSDKEYRPIDSSCISPLYQSASLNVTLPVSHVYVRASELRKKFNADRRLMFANRIQINSKLWKTGMQKCAYKPNYLFLGDNLPLFYGQGCVKKDLRWPYDHTNYHDEKGKHHEFLNESIASSIGGIVFNSINKENKGVFKLNQIVNVEENVEKKRYFVELDLENTIDGKLYRFSDYILKPYQNNDQVCLPESYANKWQHNVTIYLVCAVKNQRHWFQYLIQSIEGLIERTNDHNIHLIAVDFHSQDANLKEYLERSKLKYTFLQMKGNFSKVKALNEGVRNIPDNNSIVFIMDLQLKIPDHIFDQARKHTIQGVMTYCPTLIRLGGSENPEYTKLSDYSIWQDIGYGMMSIFKSDWDRIGGMNEEMFAYKWGGEDWEFVDRVILGKLELIHHRLPGFYHIYHSTLGTWDGTKLS